MSKRSVVYNTNAAATAAMGYSHWNICLCQILAKRWWCLRAWHDFWVLLQILLHCADEAVGAHIVTHISLGQTKVSDLHMAIGV